MAKQENNRRRVTVPISGLDTSTPDLTVADGKCEELHNLRWKTGGWHNIDPLKIKHTLRATEENRELFSKLSIIYHHPAAGDNTYIASMANNDGTIDLFLATVADGTLHIDTGNICPIYIDNRWIGSVETLSQAVFLISLQPVASDVSVAVNYRETSFGQEYGTSTLTIPKGATQSNYIRNAVSENNENAYTVPSLDDTYRYRVFTSEAAARRYNGAFVNGLPADIRISHFGNVLIVMDLANKHVIYYYLNSGCYEEFQMPSPPIVRQSMELVTTYTHGKTRIKFITQEGAADGKLKLFNQDTGLFYFPQTDGEFFWGEICFFCIFQMSDGSLIAPSALNIAASEPYYCGLNARTYNTNDVMSTEDIRVDKIDNEHICRVGSSSVISFMICPFLTITIPAGINTQLIRYVNLYSTRINPIWDAEKLAEIPCSTNTGGTNSGGWGKYTADNKLPEQPFYLAKSISIDEFSENQYTMYLTGNLLKDIEQSTVYTPVDAHLILYDTCKEYNSRLHVGGEIYLKLFNGYGSEFFRASSVNPDKAIATTIRIDDLDYHVITPSTDLISNADSYICNKILSYPDYRATFIRDKASEGNTSTGMFKLLPAKTTNFAYAIQSRDYEISGRAHLDYVKFSAAFWKIGISAQAPPLNFVSFVPQRNKLRVSAANNPLSFPLANSYAIGSESNRILAVNSAAIEMSDAKFGEFPLYVFTEEGIFTLRSGSGEVLYSATIPLNYDRIINPVTLAVNQNILYITARGIMAMFSNESRLISEPLNGRHNIPPLDYLRTAKMCYQPSHNELIVWNPEQAIDRIVSGSRAYVFSLDGSYWSTRDFDGEKLNTNELFVRQDPEHLRLLDLDEEETLPGQPVRVRMVSRPLKFGSTEYKRLESLILRLHTSEAGPMRLMVEGSADLKTWTTLRNAELPAVGRDILLRRFPCSMCYLRVTFEATVGAQLEFTQFDMEYYLRFLHRLR